MKKQSEYFYSDGIRLAADLYLPDDLEIGQQRAGVVLCNGLGSIKEMTLPALARVFVEGGYVALAFDYRGFGESAGKRWRLIPMEQVSDVRNAITYLSARAEVDADSIGLYGNSFGSANAVYAASLDARAKCVVGAIGFSDGTRWQRGLRPYWQWREFLQRLREDRTRTVVSGESEYVDPDVIMPADPESDAWRKDVLKRFPQRAYKLPLETAAAILEFCPEQVVSRIAPRPLMVVALEDDALSPLDEAEKLVEAAGDPTELVVLTGFGHHAILSGPGFDAVMEHALRWFSTHMPSKAS